MQKKCRKGFLLMETLIVSITVSSILIYLFYQFDNMKKNYDNSFNYNNVNDMYIVNTIRNFYLKNSDESQQGNLKSNVTSNKIIKLECSNSNYWSPDANICNTLLTNEYIKNTYVIPVNFDVNNDLNKVISYSGISEGFVTFIKNMTKYGNITNSSSDNYYMVIEFKNNRIAYLKLFDE